MNTSVCRSRAGIRHVAFGRFTLWGALLAFTFASLAADALTLTAVQSRKAHGAAGEFDISIDTTQIIGGALTVEPRMIGAGHQIVFQFDGPVSAAGIATATDENGLTVGTVTAVAAVNDVVVTLAGIPDIKSITISLVNVNGAVSPPPVSVAFMVGDVNSTRSVNSGDISGVKARSGQTTTALNFKFDVNLTGAINSSDISAIKARSGQAMPIVVAASVQIAAARVAADGAASLPVVNALVTYVKPFIGADPAGFFVQSQQLGPALFIAVDPATLTPVPAAGDRVSFTITTMATVASLRQAASISGFSRLSAGNAFAGLVQDVSGAANLASGIDSYESELIRVVGTISGAFQASGSGYLAAPFNTAGVTGSLQLRVPSTLVASLSLAQGCQVTLNQVPMWRFNATAQVSGWVAGDLTAVSCAPTFTLIVSKTGAGSGSVTSSVPGINCGVACSQTYSAGTVVTLTATPASGSTFSGWGGACAGTGTCNVTMDAPRSVSAGFTPINATPPPDPATVASSIDPTVATNINTATAFLYTGANPIQTGVAPGTIEARRTAVLRGMVHTRDGAALSGVTITILAHPEFGQTVSRVDGAFDLAVNGGGQLTVNYQKSGFLPVQRAVVAPWGEYASAPDVVMISFDTAVTTVDLNVASMQVARGSPVIDVDGARQATILFPAGTTAMLVLPNGSTQPLNTLNVRASEYTVGDSGPNAMPAPLPPSSGYTYAVELSVDEAVAAGATEVRFSQAVPTYVENFLGFPVGGAVPAGYYDRVKGQWIASANGRVIKVLGITGGLADLDTDGDTVIDDATKLTALGITDAERTRLAQLYLPGQTLWRVPITHFTPWDFNWPFGPPLDAIAPPGNKKKPKVKKTNKRCGSIIGCEDQSLGEAIPVSGTPWQLHYQSERTPGRRDAYTLNIPVSGPAAIPSSMRAMRVEVKIAGRLYRQAFAPVANLNMTVTWDGLDAYGRRLQGAQYASVYVHYDYVPQYYASPADQLNSFARAAAAGAAVSGHRSENITLSKNWVESVGPWDARALGMGGWSLSIQHAYDAASGTLLLGDGRQRSADALPPIITTVAGTSEAGNSGDGGPATAAQLYSPIGLAVGPDGSLYIGDSQNAGVRRIGPDGIITRFAGNGVFGFSGDGGAATAAQVGTVYGIAAGADGSIYFTDGVGIGSHRIRRVGRNGIITTVAGSGMTGFSGDGGPATAAELAFPTGVAVGADGTLYIADWQNHRIRRVGPDGIITTAAGQGQGIPSGDGGPATAAFMDSPRGVAVAPDGTLFIAEYYLIRRVGPDGIITTVAGDGAANFLGDGGPATQARLAYPWSVAVAADGSLMIADYNNNRIRLVGSDGIIATITGNGEYGFVGDGGPATAANLARPQAVAVGPDGSLYIADTNNFRVRHVRPALTGGSIGDSILAAEDGREVYVFNTIGRHLRTLDSLTGSVRHQFSYDATGYLTSITDGSGNVTAIERTGAIASAIVAAGGQRTTLNVNASGWLHSATNPASQAHTMTYSADGLMQTFADPRNQLHQFTYDVLGRLIKDENPAGGSTTLARTQQNTGHTVTTTSALGRVESFQVEQLPTGAVRRTVTAPSGTRTITLIGTDDSEQTTYADGSSSTVTYGPDPRWGMLAPVATRAIVTTPGGRTRTVTAARTATLADPNNLLSLTNLTDTVTVNGNSSSRVYSDNGTTRTLTVSAASGRNSTLTLDALGRTTRAQAPGIDPVIYTYDSRGLLNSIVEGSGASSRTTTVAASAAYELTGVTDALGRTLGLAYDSAGRLVTATLPGARTVTLAYDASGNATALTPPGRTAHGFGYTPIDEIANYTPPDLGSGTTTTQFTYDADRALTRITRPDTQLIDVTFDAVGRASSVGIARGTIGFSYSATTDQLTGIAAPDGLGLSYGYDSELLTGVTWSGAITGATAYTYNNDLRVTGESVNGANSVNFAYGADGMLSAVGSLALTRNTQNGLLTGTTLGSVADSLTHSARAEASNYSASYVASAIYNAAYSRDSLGRITQKIETVGGAATTYGYSYDTAGRLSAVSKDAVAASSYTYDSNGNRTARTGPALTASYDAQDRLTSYGGTTYSYTANGELLSKANGAQTTAYQYDVLGNLLKVTLPSANVIDYLIDGQNRRVGKKVNGALVQGFLYQGSLRPVAELDGSNAIVSRFVYATHINVPDYLIKGGVTYRIITDQLGSPRLVVDVATGTVAQRIDYDEFGQVINDTNPGFQPFGFAGGIYDRESKLLRFGARDYDAEAGRWTAKDPIRFAGKDTNLYAYVGNDPVNVIDSTGLKGVCVNDPLTVRSKDTSLLRQPNSSADRITHLQPGDTVKWLRFDQSTGFDQVEVTLPGGGTAQGYVLRQNLQASPVLPEFDASSGRPMSNQAYSSAGAGTKG